MGETYTVTVMLCGMCRRWPPTFHEYHRTKETGGSGVVLECTWCGHLQKQHPGAVLWQEDNTGSSLPRYCR